MKTSYFIGVFFCLAFLYSCSESGTNTAVSGTSSDEVSLFEFMPSDHHNIKFNNIISEDAQVNYLAHEAVFDGGGVGVGDFNNDGLPDVFSLWKPCIR